MKESKESCGLKRIDFRYQINSLHRMRRMKTKPPTPASRLPANKQKKLIKFPAGWNWILSQIRQSNQLIQFNSTNWFEMRLNLIKLLPDWELNSDFPASNKPIINWRSIECCSLFAFDLNWFIAPPKPRSQFKIKSNCKFNGASNEVRFMF